MLEFLFGKKRKKKPSNNQKTFKPFLAFVNSMTSDFVPKLFRNSQQFFEEKEYKLYSF